MRACYICSSYIEGRTSKHFADRHPVLYRRLRVITKGRKLVDVFDAMVLEVED